MTLLSTTSLSGASVTISNISQDYTELLVLINNANVSGVGGYQIFVRPNNSTNSSGASQEAQNNGDYSNDSIKLSVNGGSPTSPQSHQLRFPNYAATDARKTFITAGIQSTGLGCISGGGIASNSAITSLVIIPTGSQSFNAGTVLIYGVK